MPLYEYQCRTCDARFERIEKVSAPSDGVCPECGAAARRLVGAPALQFKGSGWYVNDYGKGNGNGAKPAATGESAGESSAESKSETTATNDSSPKSESSSTSETSSKSESGSKSETSAKTASKVA